MEDPDATIRLIIAALDDDDTDQLAWSCADLAEWLERGGYWPEKANLVALLHSLTDYWEDIR